MVFILQDIKNNGVYAVNDTETGARCVTMIVDKDDCQRNHDLLMANGFKRKLRVMEVDAEVVRTNCVNHGYDFSVITSDDIVVPPEEEDKTP